MRYRAGLRECFSLLISLALFEYSEEGQILPNTKRATSIDVLGAFSIGRIFKCARFVFVIALLPGPHVRST